MARGSLKDQENRLVPLLPPLIWPPSTPDGSERERKRGWKLAGHGDRALLVRRGAEQARVQHFRRVRDRGRQQFQPGHGDKRWHDHRLGHHRGEEEGQIRRVEEQLPQRGWIVQD